MSPSLVDPHALALFDLLDQAVWITDPDAAHIIWANRAALDVWRAESLEELLSRQLTPSPTIRTNLLHLRDRVVAGERVMQQRTLFPKGQPTRVDMTFGPYALKDGRMGLLVEARPVRQIDPEVVRASEAVRYAPLVVVTFALDGAMIQANVLARQIFGNSFSLESIFVHAQDIAQLHLCVDRGETFSRDARVKTVEGKRWYAIEARKVVDAVTAQPAILMSAHDMSARIEAEQAKDDLVSVVSHELRTPMTAIRGAIELLTGGVADGQEELTKELLHIAAENTRRLSSLVDDLLDVGKIASGHISFDLKACDLGAILQNSVHLHAPVAKQKNIELVAVVHDPLPILADEGRIQQVILNLVSNAVKHSPPGSRVRIEGEIRNKFVRLSVTDEGPGVPESFRDRIFQRFSQADASTTRMGSGTGLGLYIAKTLVELHGGTLRFENLHGGGAQFYFDLPLRDTVYETVNQT